MADQQTSAGKPLDRRLHAFRPDLAELALEGKVDAARFTAGEAASIAQPVVALRPRPEHGCGIDTELLLGEPVTVLDRASGWAWVKAGLDNYVGYLPEEALGAPETGHSHIIATPRSFLYTGPDLRFPNAVTVSMGSRVKVVGEAETRGTRYFELSSGQFVIARHCLEMGTPPAEDYVALAARFLETPYLWGGRSGLGIDCSGLVQLCLQMMGKTAPRDTDMQFAGLGTPIEREALRRGDLVFWKGHVAIMEDEKTILHANGHTMSVAREDFEGAVARIGWLYEQPTGYRRL
ncbi:C40 family peptidase [Rhizobium paknamense]|uniref:Cell wall-associated NlpC family hydrolase n=1 Tax=Rhizobium paknamense TaxID=1206817 RepID=A0ABU0IB69_9HYPH|nr:NlpC/P60 family protein [Rhizobium paknamense]MDQ0455441.1 cell wall-associated NlpC family hydrolase [Rhizobium paknamense]